LPGDGAGRTEVARAIFGADPIDSGEIFVHGTQVLYQQPDRCSPRRDWLSLRRSQALWLAVGLDVQTNVVLASLNKFLSFIGTVDDGATRATAQLFVDNSPSRRRASSKKPRIFQAEISKRS